jgi:hypothetical protein
MAGIPTPLQLSGGQPAQKMPELVHIRRSSELDSPLRWHLLEFGLIAHMDRAQVPDRRHQSHEQTLDLLEYRARASIGSHFGNDLTQLNQTGSEFPSMIVSRLLQFSEPALTSLLAPAASQGGLLLLAREFAKLPSAMNADFS